MTEFRPGSFQILPVVIKNLLIINGLVYLAQLIIDGLMASGDLAPKVGYIANTFALHHIFSPLFKPWQLFTHLFLHGSLMHLFGNMFALWMFGSVLENLWGPQRFFIFYMLCGLGAALMHMGFLWHESAGLLADLEAFKAQPTFEHYAEFFKKYQLFAYADGGDALRVGQGWQLNPADTQYIDQAIVAVTNFTNFELSEPTLGASGAVFGCLAAFAYLFPNTHIYLYFLVPVKAKWLILAYLAFELAMAVQNSAGDNIARWAHLGGALIGFLLVFFWNKTNRRRFY
jgi:membrane associated rhomboid family serine protease